MEPTRDTILEELKRLKPYLKEHGIDQIGLFGSRAQGSEAVFSDIDIVIHTTDLLREKHPGFEAFAFLEDLRQNLGRTFGRKIDLCDRSSEWGAHVTQKAIFA
ncbi:MAG: nucleotidyltransferase domain-containing protein [Campylobacterales bacterium]|nr:nucleotidyltransferase domain-containing protein [Campylobacterales bacterium]